jgi:hypothetical protein
MNAPEAVLELLRDARRLLVTVMQDADVELIWRPAPGVANPIGAVYAHAIGVEDLYIQRILQGKPTLWESQAWAERLGLPVPPNDWNGVIEARPAAEALLPYRVAVYEASDAYVTSLTPERLSDSIEFPGSHWTMLRGQLLGTVITHTAGHAGEIAALKGVFGVKGLPF